jgi:hypothetical protein
MYSVGKESPARLKLTIAPAASFEIERALRVNRRA